MRQGFRASEASARETRGHAPAQGLVAGQGGDDLVFHLREGNAPRAGADPLAVDAQLRGRRVDLEHHLAEARLQAQVTLLGRARGQGHAGPVAAVAGTGQGDLVRAIRCQFHGERRLPAELAVDGDVGAARAAGEFEYAGGRRESDGAEVPGFAGHHVESGPVLGEAGGAQAQRLLTLQYLHGRRRLAESGVADGNCRARGRRGDGDVRPGGLELEADGLGDGAAGDLDGLFQGQVARRFHGQAVLPGGNSASPQRRRAQGLAVEAQRRARRQAGEAHAAGQGPQGDLVALGLGAADLEGAAVGLVPLGADRQRIAARADEEALAEGHGEAVDVDVGRRLGDHGDLHGARG